jgi:uncharacterized membrane protein
VDEAKQNGVVSRRDSQPATPSAAGVFRCWRWGLVAVTGLAFALRVAGLSFQSLWRDEVDAIRFAREPLAELLHRFVEPGHNGPLYYLLLRPWLDLVGDSEFSLRFFSVVAGVLTILLIYRLARRLFPQWRSVALLAALLAATSPYLLWYSQEGKMYALVVVLILLSMERYLAALKEGGWHRWLVYVIASSVAIYVHVIAALIVPAQAIVFFLQSKGVRIARWKPWLASIALLVVPYLPLLAWQWPLLLKPAETGFQFVPLQDMFYSLLVNYSLGVMEGATLWTVALFVSLLLAAGLFWLEKDVPPASVGLLVCWLLVPILAFFLITLNRPLYTARYLIFVLPAYLLLLAAGLVAIGRHSRLLAGLLLAALLVVNGWGTYSQASTPYKADFRSATQYVSSRWQSGDLIIFQIPYGQHSFDYYLAQQRGGQGTKQPAAGGHRVFLPMVAGGGGKPYRWAEGLYTNWGMEPAEVDRHMAELVAGNRRVWLVSTEVSMWDEQRLVQGWLAEHARLVDKASFVRVTVERYEFP